MSVSCLAEVVAAVSYVEILFKAMRSDPEEASYALVLGRYQYSEIDRS